MNSTHFKIDLHKNYPGFQMDIGLELFSGEFFSLLGPSGCGKTTLLRLIAGLESHDWGSIVLNGTEVSGLPPTKRRIGMMFQEYALFPHLSVAENIVYGLKAQKAPAVQIADKLQRMLTFFQLEPLKNRNVQQLSGGEKQRVALARSLVTEPELLMLDEPFSALDYGLRAKLRRDLRDYQKALGFTTIFVTHHQEEALTLSDRLGVMANGRLLQVGPALELYEKPRDRFVAEFIGEANFLRCCFRDAGLWWRPTGENDENILLGPLPESTAWPGAWQEMMARPEDITIDQPSAPSFSPIAAVITRIDYLGHLYRLEACSGQHPWIIYRDKTDFNRREGEKVSLYIAREALKRISG